MAEEETQQQEEPKKKKKIPLTLVLIVGVTIVEAIGFFAVSKMMGAGTQTAHGAEAEEGHVLEGDPASDAPASVEIDLLKHFKVPNSDGGRPYIYDFDITVKTPGHRKEEVEKLVAEHKGEISDRIARIVRKAKRTQLHEAELKTLKMQFQHAVGEVAGDQDLILEVLIPRCVPIRAD